MKPGLAQCDVHRGELWEPPTALHFNPMAMVADSVLGYQGYI